MSSRLSFEREVYLDLKSSDNLVIVYLDDEQYRKPQKVVCSTNIYKEFIPPSFDEKLQELKDEYFDYHVMAKVHKSGLDLSYDKHLAIGLNIAVLLRKILEDRIVDLLPPKEKMPNGIDPAIVQSELMKANELDDLFFFNLTQTQAFNHFLHKHYSKLK